MLFTFGVRRCFPLACHFPADARRCVCVSIFERASISRQTRFLRDLLREVNLVFARTRPRVRWFADQPRYASPTWHNETCRARFFRTLCDRAFIGCWNARYCDFYVLYDAQREYQRIAWTLCASSNIVCYVKAILRFVVSPINLIFAKLSLRLQLNTRFFVPFAVSKVSLVVITRTLNVGCRDDCFFAFLKT